MLNQNKLTNILKTFVTKQPIIPKNIRRSKSFDGVCRVVEFAFKLLGKIKFLKYK